MSFTFIPPPITDLYEIHPKVFEDNRGYFLESYSKKEFAVEGINLEFVQDNQSLSEKGVLRGLHFQKHHSQGKLISVVEGKIYDIAVDLRNESPTFGKYVGLVLDSEKKNMFLIPKGFAHGFYVLSDKAIISYKCSDFYHPEDEETIIWNDKTLNVDWGFANQVDLENLKLSAKDLKGKAFDPSKKYFDMKGNWIGE